MSTFVTASVITGGFIGVVWLMFSVVIKYNESRWLCMEEDANEKPDKWYIILGAFPGDLIEVVLTGIIGTILTTIVALALAVATCILQPIAWVIRDVKASNETIDLLEKWRPKKLSSLTYWPLFLVSAMAHAMHYLTVKRTIKYIAFRQARGWRTMNMVKDLGDARLYKFDRAYQMFNCEHKIEWKKEPCHLRRVS